MRNLEKVIDEYLGKPTDFAVQIIGKWGYGKTYYYRNVLEDLILQKECQADNSKKYKAIYISLFGLKSIEDIATKIVMDFYQSKLFKDYQKNSIKRRKLKITESILRIGLRGFINFQKFGNVNDYLADVKTIGENVLDTNELVICFDDLERKDSALKIEDLTGYINSLVDEGIKVVIIANEDLLLKEGDQYKNLKEKIIGISIEYIPDVYKTINSIIERRYAGFPTYNAFLKENVDHIVKVSESADNNFRHVIFALDALHHCYSKIRKEIIDPKHEINDHLQRELKGILLFTVSLAIEFKSSAIKYKDAEYFTTTDILIFKRLMNEYNQNESELTKSKLEEFLEKYKIESADYRFYESVFNYVTAINEFDIDLFIQEYRKKFNLEKGKILPEYELLNDLGYEHCFKLLDDEYRRKTLEMIQYAVEGKYQPAEYYTAMHYAERMDNILELDLSRVKNDLIGGLSKSISKTQLQQGLNFTEFRMTGQSGGMSDLNRKIYEEGIRFIKDKQKADQQARTEGIAELLLYNPAEFEDKVRTDSQFQSDLNHLPFMGCISTDKLMSLVKGADSDRIAFLRHFFKDRYEDPNKLINEEEFLTSFIRILREYQNELEQNIHGNKIRHFIIKEFAESMQELLRSKIES